MLNCITPIIICYNEEANLTRTLAALRWATTVLVIDSGSYDRTLSICAQHQNVQLIQNPFENFAQQCNFALAQNIATEWVLSLDADYVLSDELIAELSTLTPAENTAGYAIGFSYLINGKPLRGSLYPDRVCLYRRQQARYQQDGHAHKVAVRGAVQRLNNVIMHDDRKPYSRWLSAQKNYAQQEAEKLRKLQFHELGLADKCRKLRIAPFLILPYTLFVKGLILDGHAGWQYAQQRCTAEWLLFKAL